MCVPSIPLAIMHVYLHAVVHAAMLACMPSVFVSVLVSVYVCACACAYACFCLCLCMLLLVLMHALACAYACFCLCCLAHGRGRERGGRTSMRIVFLKARMSAGLLSRIGYCSSMNLVVSDRLTCTSASRNGAREQAGSKPYGWLLSCYAAFRQVHSQRDSIRADQRGYRAYQSHTRWYKYGNIPATMMG